MKISNSLFNRDYKKIMDSAPDYVGTLLSSEWIKLEVEDDGPALAWTYYDTDAQRFVVSFHKAAAEMSPRAIGTLWRHEIGHISLGHFQQALCLPDKPRRSRHEQLIVSDIHINNYLPAEDMVEVGQKSLSIVPEEVRNNPNVKVEENGYVDPSRWLPEIGLKHGNEYPYEIIHIYFHEWLEKQIDEAEGSGEGSAEGSGSGDGIEGNKEGHGGFCGGIQGVDDASGMAEASAAVVAGVASSGGEDGISEKWGTQGSMSHVRIPESNLPSWIEPLHSFARAIVEVVLANKNSHTRPIEAFKAYDVHMPTLRPRWDYQPAQICFLVDTSGSMMDDLRYVNPVIDYLARHNIKTRLIAGDTRVTFDEIVTKAPGTIVGGGGTEITPLFDRAKEYSPESIVCFTDGYVPAWPKDPGVPVLWVGVKNKAPYGKSA